MEAYERQQFDWILNAAIERFVERVEQRCGGPVPARERLRRDPNGEGVWLDEFVHALFRDFLLEGVAGACFVLEALSRRPAPALGDGGGDVGTTLQAMAHATFAVLLRAKAEEALEQRLAFQVTD